MASTRSTRQIRRRRLTPEKIDAIRRRLAEKQSQTRIASVIGVSRDSVQRIARRAKKDGAPSELATDPHMRRLEIRDARLHADAVAARLRHADQVIDSRGLSMMGAGPWAMHIAEALLTVPEESLDDELAAFRRFVRRRIEGHPRLVPPLPMWDEFLNSPATRRAVPTRLQGA